MKKQILLVAIMIPIIAFSQNQDSIKNVRPDSLTNKVVRLGEVKIIASRGGVARLPEIVGTNIYSGKKMKSFWLSA